MIDETITTDEEMHDLRKYKDEIGSFVKKKRVQLSKTSQMEKDYTFLRDIIFAGGTVSDEQRFPHASEMFKVYKSALIQACLSGYSALLEISGLDAYSMMKTQELKKVMTEQFKSMSLLENLTAETLDDWILKGEAVSFIKLKENKEQYRFKETVYNQDNGEPVMKFKMKEVVSYDTISIDRIDPLDFYVDALDYRKDPRGCVKIVRSWIDTKTLLTSNAYPLLSTEEKRAIATKVGNNGSGNVTEWGNDYPNDTNTSNRNETDLDKIEVLTFFGDYITSDYKVLRNIKAVVVAGQVAELKYCGVSTNRIIYAPYKVDDYTHRSVSPLASTKPINKLVNSVTDMFIQNLDDTSNPILLAQKGSITLQQTKDARKNRFLEYNSIDDKPEFYAPPVAATNGLQLVQMILEQNKNVLGLNNYLTGDTSGSVRTARESAILFQNANARMRVETDVFSYNYLLALFVSFYAFNRELALAADRPLNDIYLDENLKVSISTNASRADKEGELRRLMDMLNLPIAQMIFSNLAPEQVIIAVRYLMAKAEISDVDNILELVDGTQQNEGLPRDVAGVQDGNVGTQGQLLDPSMLMGQPNVNNSNNQVM